MHVHSVLEGEKESRDDTGNYTSIGYLIVADPDEVILRPCRLEREAMIGPAGLTCHAFWQMMIYVLVNNAEFMQYMCEI